LEDFAALRDRLVDHLKAHALRTDGPFRLASGATSDWYVDGRQTTYSGEGGRLVGACVAHLADPGASVIGGMTMGADPVAIAAALVASRPMRSFSVRQRAKDHGVGGRIVGPVGPGDRAVVVDDTTTTGASLVEAISVLRSEGVEVVQAIVVVDRSGGAARARVEALGVPFRAVVEPADLGVA